MQYNAQLIYGMSRIVVVLIRAERLDRAGYDSVFMVALALIGVDVVLRSIMIEPTKPHVKSLEGENEPLLGNNPSIDHQNRSLDQQSHPDIENSPLPTTPSRIPPIVRLAMSDQLLVLLIASAVDAVIWTTLETVFLL